MNNMKQKSKLVQNDLEKRIDIILKEIFRIEKKNDKQFSEIHGGVRQIQSAVDAYAKKADTYFQEMLMLARKVDRLERWIFQVAEKVGIRLKS